VAPQVGSRLMGELQKGAPAGGNATGAGMGRQSRRIVLFVRAMQHCTILYCPRLVLCTDSDLGRPAMG